MVKSCGWPHQFYFSYLYLFEITGTKIMWMWDLKKYLHLIRLITQIQALTATYLIYLYIFIILYMFIYIKQRTTPVISASGLEIEGL